MYVSLLINYIYVKKRSYKKIICISTAIFHPLSFMNNNKKLKIYLGSIYFLILSVFLWYFFNNFSIDEVTNYDFLRKNRDFFFGIKENNFFLVLIAFVLFTIIWVLLLGFGSPVALIAGFIFGKWIGTLVVSISLSIGATFLYLFANYFLKETIKEKFEKKFSYLKEKIEKNEFVYFLIYRFIGGIPFFIANILPVLFNIKVKNYFFGTLLGILPQLFIITSLGSGFENIIQQNTTPPSFFGLISSKEIYLPILSFFILIIIIFFVKKKF